MITLLPIRQAQRIAVVHPRLLAKEIAALAAARHRAPMTGALYLSHAAGCGLVVRAERAAEAWFFFRSDEAETALVIHCLGRIGRELQEVLR